MIVRRDNREKTIVPIDEIAARTQMILDQEQQDMFERAKAHRDSHTYDAPTREELSRLATERPGFIRAMWCGSRECEDRIKEEFGLTSRCIPFAQAHISDTCVCCGKKAEKLVYWGKAY